MHTMRHTQECDFNAGHHECHFTEQNDECNVWMGINVKREVSHLYSMMSPLKLCFQVNIDPLDFVTKFYYSHHLPAAPSWNDFVGNAAI